MAVFGRGIELCDVRFGSLPRLSSGSSDRRRFSRSPPTAARRSSSSSRRSWRRRTRAANRSCRHRARGRHCRGPLRRRPGRHRPSRRRAVAPRGRGRRRADRERVRSRQAASRAERRGPVTRIHALQMRRPEAARIEREIGDGAAGGRHRRHLELDANQGRIEVFDQQWKRVTTVECSREIQSTLATIRRAAPA